MSAAQPLPSQTAAELPAVVATNEAGTAIPPVKRVAEEITHIMAEMHELKADIMARGIQFHAVNVMVEMGAQNKLEELASLRNTALESSVKQYGPAAISPDKLDEKLTALVALERDLGHVRKLGKDQGLDMTALNLLTMTIRQNPGDGGELMINTLLAYALTCGIPLHRVEELAATASSGPASVLPVIEAEEVDIRSVTRKRVITDVCVGCVIAFIAIALLT